MFVTHFFENGVSGVKHLLRMAQKFYPASPVFAAAFCCAIGVTATSGATAVRKSYDVQGGDAAATLTQFARHSGCQIVYLVENVRGEKTQPVRGEYAALDALRVMLAGTALFAVQDESTGALVVSRKRPAPAQKELEASERSRGPPAAVPAPPPDTPKTAQPNHKESPPVNKRNFLALFAGWLTLPVVPVASGAEVAAPRGSDATIVLSPFEVVTNKDDGFAASNAGTATRMALDMKDVPAPYSVMTREFIEALNITNVAEAAWWATNGAPVVNGDMAQQPTQFNTRGVDNNSGQQRNNYLTSGILDSYAIERYDFGRGPNAALFNVGGASSLGGGMGAQTKRPRYDRAFDTIAFTYGSWDYKRSTLDVNRPLTDKLAVRGNAVWFDRNGYRMNEFERTKGVTAGGSYLLAPKTEIRLEGAYDRTQRNNPTMSIYDSITGWDGVTVFRGPISNAMLGTQTVPGTPTSLGQVLTFQGETQGVERRGGEYYVWDPFSGQNRVMNYQNEGFTRRADATANTPILANGVLYTRGTGLPFGNGATGVASPAASQNPNAEVNFLYQINLPDDRFSRALAGSKFRMPDKRFTQGFDSALYVQDTKDVNLTFTHQVGNSWFLEIGGDINRVYSTTARDGAQGTRTVRIDINQLLPNGMANPHFLEPYGDSPIGYTIRNFLNRSVRGNVGHRRNAGKWGDYTFNLNLASSLRTTENRNRKYSIATLPDTRMWQSSAQVIYIRQYWSNPSRPYGDGGVPAALSQNVFSADNATYTTSNTAMSPRWTLADWNDTDEKFENAVLAISARYFGGKLAFLAAERYDRYKSQLYSRMEYGDLPTDWDGRTMLYKPAAPSDWATLSYLPRNATTGVATATKAIPAVTRPRQNAPGVVTNNGVQIYNPFFANDRFRNDYSPPANTGTGLTGTYGVVYHALKHVSFVANYGTSYVPPPTNAFTLNNELVVPLTGRGYDGGLRFRFFDDRLTVNANYFYNREDHQRVDPAVKTSINALMSRNAASDSSLDGRNVQGLPDIFGTDYQSVKTSGVELEVVGRIARGWRLMFNLGTAKVFTFNRWPQAKTLVPENADRYRQVLEDAGGRLDTAQHPNGAPGLAVVNSTVTAAIGSEQTGAVNDYNNIWANYALILNDRPILGQDRMSVNMFSDYTVQSGKLKGLRVGLGGQFAGNYYVGSRNADTIVDPANPTRAIDDPAVSEATPIYSRRPWIFTATLGYSVRLKGGWKRLEGKELSFQMVIRNLLNNQSIVYNGLDVIARPPNGDFTKPNRVSITPRNYIYTEPTSILFTTTLKL